MHTPTDASTQLIELGQPEGLSVIDDNGIGRRDIEARLNDRRTQQEVKVALQKLHHNSFKRPLGHLPVGYTNATLGDEPLQQRLHGREGVNTIVHKEHLATSLQFIPNGPLDRCLRIGGHHGLDSTPSFWWCGDDTAIA